MLNISLQQVPNRFRKKLNKLSINKKSNHQIIWQGRFGHMFCQLS